MTCRLVKMADGLHLPLLSINFLLSSVRWGFCFSSASIGRTLAFDTSDHDACDKVTLNERIDKEDGECADDDQR